MADAEKQEKLRLGFLTAVELAEGGFVAGLLVTNRFGRPLEFQCTMPVKPNRTQELLYGPTLVPFILGELIGKTLFEKVAVKPHLIITDRAEILDLRAHVCVPVACLNDADDAPSPAESRPELQLGRHKFRFHSAHRADPETVTRKAAEVVENADLREPLDRIREALSETMSIGAAR